MRRTKRVTFVPFFPLILRTTLSRVKPFVDFVLSAEGQKIVLAEGYVPLK